MVKSILQVGTWKRKLKQKMGKHRTHIIIRVQTDRQCDGYNCGEVTPLIINVEITDDMPPGSNSIILPSSNYHIHV